MTGPQTYPTARNRVRAEKADRQNRGAGNDDGQRIHQCEQQTGEHNSDGCPEDLASAKAAG